MYSEKSRNVAPNGLIPLVNAIPLMIDPMLCSRTPKWRLRPFLSSCVNDSKLFKLVLVDGVRFKFLVTWRVEVREEEDEEEEVR